MDCVTCGLEAGYNRIVVDVPADEEVGGFCLRCEKSEFGNSLDRGYWTRGGTCALCDRDGFYALAKWEAITKEVDDRIVCTVDYRVADDTVHLCDEHLHAILNYTPTSRASRASRGHPGE